MSGRGARHPDHPVQRQAGIGGQPAPLLEAEQAGVEPDRPFHVGHAQGYVIGAKNQLPAPGGVAMRRW